MSTPQPPTRDHASADPTRPWVQQTAAPTSTPSSTQPEPSQTPPSPPTPQQPVPRNPSHPSIGDAVSSIKPSDFLTFHQAPCSRTGLLTGIGTGAAVGGLRWIMGLPVPRAANWAVGVGALAAVGQYEYCQLRRRQEREKVKRVVEVYAAKQAREKAAEEEMRRAREKEREERERAEKEKAGRGWWRVW